MSDKPIAENETVNVPRRVVAYAIDLLLMAAANDPAINDIVVRRHMQEVCDSLEEALDA